MDIGPDGVTLGWYFYLNFTAEEVRLRGALRDANHLESPSARERCPVFFGGGGGPCPCPISVSHPPYPAAPPFPFPPNQETPSRLTVARDSIDTISVQLNTPCP
jgi:hypothetical protein